MSADELYPDHEAMRDDLPAYALGALPSEEADELEAHLESCSTCRELLRWLTPAVDVLPAAVPQRTPPPGLRENLMAVVRAEAAEPADGAGSAGARHPRSNPWWRRFAVRPLRPGTALAAAVLLVAGLAGGYVMRGGGAGSDAATTFVEAEPLGGNPSYSATLELHGSDSATLHVNELPELPPNRVYEVWLERAGVMEPSTLFVLDANDAGVAALPGPFGEVERVLVTEEPRGGSQRPSTPPLLAATLD